MRPVGFKLLATMCLLISGQTLASDNLELNYQPTWETPSSHSFFLNSDSHNLGFDSWKIDSGYAYSFDTKMELYLGTRVYESEINTQRGIIGGVSYQLTPRVLMQSALTSHSEIEETTEGLKQETTKVSAEVTSRFKLTDNLDIKATYDYQEWQQGIEVGLGFSF